MFGVFLDWLPCLARANLQRSPVEGSHAMYGATRLLTSEDRGGGAHMGGSYVRRTGRKVSFLETLLAHIVKCVRVGIPGKQGTQDGKGKVVHLCRVNLFEKPRSRL